MNAAMGSIMELSTGARRLLQPEHLVGRSPRCALRLGVPYVSAEHALLRWTGGRWELKDLGSRNGTYLDGARLEPGEDYVLRAGSRFAFGKRLEQRWELVDASPPRVMAVPLDGGEPVLLEGTFLVLPSADDPRATIYRAGEGTWLVEYPDDSTGPITDPQIFEIDGRAWRFCCAKPPRVVPQAAPSELEVGHLQLSFSVSRRDGDVALHTACGGRAFDMGRRAHHGLLLRLARRRLADAADGLPESHSGWTYEEDLAEPGAPAPRLDLDVFRIRKQFAAIGVSDAVQIVQRRPRTRQYRIGTGLLSIVAL